MTKGIPRAHYFCVLGSALLAATCSYGAGVIEIDEDSWVSVGGGLRAGYSSVSSGAPNGSDNANKFDAQSVRLYVNGQVNETVKFTFNTACVSCVFGTDADDSLHTIGEIAVLDAIAQFEFNPQFNIWVGRMLTPADRIEMNGPYYGLNWNQYTVPLLPSDQLGSAGLLGRDDGVTLWGGIGKLQYAAGLFDGIDGGPNQGDNSLFSGRVAYNFLNMESNPGYYTSSTYFGGLGDIFTLGLSYQNQADGVGTKAGPADFSAVILDVLFEKVLSGGAVFTVDAEYKSFSAPIDTTAAADADCFCLFDGESNFITAAYLFANSGTMMGTEVKYQPYLRHTSNNPTKGASSDLNEVGLNFVINGHNARLNVNYTNGDANLTGTAAASDTSALSFNVQIQI